MYRSLNYFVEHHALQSWSEMGFNIQYSYGATDQAWEIDIHNKERKVTKIRKKHVQRNKSNFEQPRFHKNREHGPDAQLR